MFSWCFLLYYFGYIHPFYDGNGRTELYMWQISLIFTNIQILNIIKLFNDNL